MTDQSVTAISHANRMPRWVMPVVTAGIFIADAVLTIACFIFAYLFREGDPIFSSTTWAWSKEFAPYAGILYFAVAARLFLLLYQRVYRFAGAFSYVQESIKIFKATLVGSLLIVAWAFLFRGGFAFREFSYSRGVFFVDFASSLAAFILFHHGLRFIQTLVRERDINLIPTLIVGTNHEAVRTASELSERKYLGYRVVGLVNGSDNDGRSKNGKLDLAVEDTLPFPVVGSIGQLAEIIKTYRIQEVIIADNSVESERLFEAMMQIGRKLRVEFRFAPKLSNILPQKTSVEQIGVLPMVRLFREPLTDVERFAKRLFDLAIAGSTSIAALPLWLLAFVVIKMDSSGPVLFKQERVGMDGRVFLFYKFRTMVAEADEKPHREMYRKNIEGSPEANTGGSEMPVYGKVKDDPRITRAGRWLRRTSLDELPQLFNVLRGEMSIVGPRPPIPYEVVEYDIWQRKRLDVKPGMTGLWQVSGRNRLTFSEMVTTDLFYIENWSLLLDLKIILLTIPAVFRGDGAR